MSCLLLCSVLLAPSGADPVRAIWVTRFEYRTESDVRSIIANCAELGFNTVLFQVRGQADAYYRSSIEPWADRLGGKDPGFDPLAVACREAHRRGLELHAWVNVFTAWRGTTPPRARGHVATRHPEWIVVDRNGRRQTWNSHYLVLNPCLPEVRAYLARVARDIASRYPIDGLHLDYVRFLEGDWSYDRETLRLFGRNPARYPRTWTAFRRSAVTQAVESIRRALHGARPGTALSAAVYPSAEARRKVHQDAAGWVRRGLVDRVFTMNYTDSDEFFRVRARENRAELGDACFPGIGAYKHASAAQTVRQMAMCRGGFALFSYSSLFVSPDDRRREDARLCTARRRAVKLTLNR